jgi:crotonobetainyl-CoA:carnitine CoA-transferase CaiB-like acyl-CoA transferase
VSGVLDGVRVLDVTAWQAGPMVTMVLGDFGAEVLKIEAANRLDGWRGGAGFMDDRRYERNPLWLAINRSKKALSLDLRTASGRELFLRLVAVSDVVVENYTPRVMADFGLAYEQLREVNDRLIMIALSGFGATGPWRDFSAFAFPTEQVSGLTYLNGMPDGPPEAVGQPVTDALVGAMGALAVVAAIERRERTGVGEFIDLSQCEVLTDLIGGELVDAQLSARSTPARRGNRRPGVVPQGVFPCKTDDESVAIAVTSDLEWTGLCRAMGQAGAELGADLALANVIGRGAVVDRLEAAVAAWTSEHTADEIVEACQSQGVPAATVMTPALLLTDAHLWDRGFHHLIEREEIDPNFIPGAVVRLTSTPGGPTCPPPLFGQHTDEVLRELLGLSDEELATLEADGVTSRQPNEQSWR